MKPGPKVAPTVERSKIMLKQVNLEPVTLNLPPAHPKQVQLINAFDARKNPVTGEVVYDDEVLKAHADWPLAFPGLRFVVGACGTKFACALSGL
jgi:hypothetical protein